MCSTPKMPAVQQIKNILPQAPSKVEEPPKPVEIAKDGQDKVKRKRNPLRIDLAAGGGGGSAGSGVNL